MRFVSSLLAAVAVIAAFPASSATILNISPTGGSTLTFDALAAGDNLTNDSPTFSNGGPLLAGPRGAYIFDEGTSPGLQSYLLHYDRPGDFFSRGRVMGSFEIALSAGETFLGYESTMAGLLATDPSNGVSYQTSPSDATDLRGLEMNDIIAVSQIGNIVKVKYNFLNYGIALDETRFLVSIPVPEPATWAMVITGFGLLGASARRRSRKMSVCLA